MTDESKKDDKTEVADTKVTGGAEGPQTIVADGKSDSAQNVEIQHLHKRLHDVEEVVHTFLTHQTSVGHEKISSWLSKIKARLSRSTPPAPKETTPDTASPSKGETASSESSTQGPSESVTQEPSESAKTGSGDKG